MLKSKPNGATHPVWTQGHYQVYVPANFKEIAVCKLCVAANATKSAEVSFKGGSPTNLTQHLNTKLAGHKEAWARVQEALAARGKGTSEKQQSITKFAREDGTNFEEKMCRFIKRKA
ncbi:unnamed protein product [Ectocarpus sp. 12 AP-2014]